MIKEEDLPPNWRCKTCGHKAHLQGMDEDRAQCPICGSKDVEDLHLQVILDENHPA
jgi:putative FmdB family regulatory protein